MPNDLRPSPLGIDIVCLAIFLRRHIHLFGPTDEIHAVQVATSLVRSRTIVRFSAGTASPTRLQLGRHRRAKK
jgi:hypothetical protein